MEAKSEFTFRNAKLPDCSYNFFACIRSQNKFCDIEFTIGTQRISAHRVILAAGIPLFRETFDNAEEISVPHIDCDVLHCLIDYAYSCELKITMENVMDLLLGASQLRMNDVQDACCDFLTQRLCPENVLNFRELTDDLNLTEFKNFIDFYVTENFEKVSKTEKFLSTPFSYVWELIGKNNLNVSSEEKVLESVLRWVKASVTERKDKLPELLQQVRMVLLKPLYLTDLVKREEIIRTSHVSRDLVDEARNYNLFPERREKRCIFPTEPRQFLKISDGTEEGCKKLYCLKAETKYTVIQLDMMKKMWDTKLAMEYWENTGSIATLNKKMYFFSCQYLFVYDPESNESELLELGTMQKRFFTATVSLRDKIIVCGGRTSGRIALNVVECFVPENNKWSQMNSLQTARWGLNAVSLGDYIYALGGKDSHTVYNVVERYSFVLGKWQYVTSMHTPRSNSGAAVLNGKIYVCGGYISVDNQCTVTAEVYDPITNNWKFISSMKTTRGELTSFSFSGNLYAIGGYGANTKPLNSCEVYDSQSDKWEYDLELVGCVHLSGAVVV